MLTTFDRYLLKRMLHTFVVFFIATYGLYVVIDLFTNVDAFQLESQNAAAAAESAGESWSDQQAFLDLVRRITLYYFYRTSDFLELAGSILITVSATTVLGLLEKHSESHPVLAAGIPAFRLLKPLLTGAAVLNLALVVNQELVIPAIALPLQTPRGSNQAKEQQVIPVYDYSNYMMHIDGESLSVRDSRLDQASFNLPEELAQGVLTLRAESAVYAPKTATHPSGWLLKNLTVVVDAERLTDEGRLKIQLRNAGRDVFVISDVSFDQLYDQGRNPKLLSSVELVKRIRNPATGSMTVRQQSLALHSRITRPILSLLTIAIALPMVLRRESPSLIFNLAVCGTVLTATFAATQGFLLLGSGGWLRPDIAAWVPVILTGATTSWTASYVQT